MTFEQAVAIVLDLEGGYVADDEGAPANFGINRRSHPDVDVTTMTRDQAVVIYRTDYWQPVRGDELPPALRLAVFDGAVNQGVGTAIRLLQAAAGVEADGVLGPVTMRVVQHTEPFALLSEFMAQRCQRYAMTSSVSRNGLGWYRRVLTIYARCH